jgi:ribosomal protein S18 acetylase RimI-like enzyme
MTHTDGFLLLRRSLADAPPAPVWPEGVTVAPLAASEAGQVHALLQRAYTNGFGKVPANLLDWWEGLLTDSEFDRNLTFVARHEDVVIGFCLCWTSSFVKDLVVDAGWRNRGIGSALLSTAISALRDRNAEEIALKVDIYNATAQRLYRGFGFVQE